MVPRKLIHLYQSLIIHIYQLHAVKFNVSNHLYDTSLNFRKHGTPFISIRTILMVTIGSKNSYSQLPRSIGQFVVPMRIWNVSSYFIVMSAKSSNLFEWASILQMGIRNIISDECRDSCSRSRFDMFPRSIAMKASPPYFWYSKDNLANESLAWDRALEKLEWTPNWNNPEQNPNLHQTDLDHTPRLSPLIKKNFARSNRQYNLFVEPLYYLWNRLTGDFFALSGEPPSALAQNGSNR